MVTGSPTVSGRTPGGIPFPGPVPPRAIRIEPLVCALRQAHCDRVERVLAPDPSQALWRVRRMIPEGK
ncbi:hypothetical protein GCM10014719_64060 [Planomonospora parontospora subsp. antibiotica]|nr:hypothetical protein GCM10014719_64060 [Planomonospora parontospora subsp. antibiotica]